MKTAHHARSARLLIVDDNVDIVQSTAALFEMRGCKVEKAYNGAQAIAKAARFCPHAIMIEMGLPDMDGYEVASRLQDIPCLRKSLLVAATSYARWDDRRHCAEAGFDLYFLKPVHLTMLEQTLWLIEESRRLQESLRQRSLEQKRALGAFIDSALEMAETFLNIAITTRDTHVKARMLDKVQRTYLRMSELVQRIDEPEQLVARIEGVKRRYDILLYTLR